MIMKMIGPIITHPLVLFPPDFGIGVGVGLEFGVDITVDADVGAGVSVGVRQS
jgi:hypothetical protein